MKDNGRLREKEIKIVYIVWKQKQNLMTKKDQERNDKDEENRKYKRGTDREEEEKKKQVKKNKISK